jgi:hypothetical protein
MTAIEKQSETTTEERDERLADTAEQAVKGLVDVGRLWAAHGLNIGRSALHASATTLRTTADLLGEIARRFEPRDDEPGAA